VEKEDGRADATATGRGATKLKQKTGRAGVKFIERKDKKKREQDRRKNGEEGKLDKTVKKRKMRIKKE